VSRYQKGKTNLDLTKARDSEWQWHQLDHMQVCTSLQTDNHASTPPLSFLQARCPSCRPTNSVKALKAQIFQQSNPNLTSVKSLTTIFAQSSVFVRESKHYADDHEWNERKLFHWTDIWLWLCNY